MTENPNSKKHTYIVIACGALMVFISMGTRQSFGLFLQPITLDLLLGRETYSLAIAWQNLLFGLPLIGILHLPIADQPVKIGRKFEDAMVKT
jgi:membrane-anchored protein YejM (alkaline phosphatase superfamily)